MFRHLLKKVVRWITGVPAAASLPPIGAAGGYSGGPSPADKPSTSGAAEQ